MSREEIISYITTEQEKGVSKDQIIDSLLAAEWKPSEIEEAFQSLEGNQTSKITSSSTSSFFKGRFFIVLAVVAGLLIASSIGVGAYFLFLQKDPHTVVRSSFAKFAQISSYEYDGNLKADVEFSRLPGQSLVPDAPTSQSDSQKITFEMRFRGQLENILSNEPSTQASIDIDLIESPYGNFRIGFDAMQFGERSFVKVRTLPFFGIDVSPLLNRWVVVEQEDIPQFALTPTPTEEGEVIEKVRSLIALYDFEFEVEDLGSATVGEYDSYHYSVTLNKNNLKGFVMELHKALEDEVLEAKDVSELDDFLSELEQASALTFEVFIDKDSLYPVRMIFSPKTIPNQSDDFEFDGTLDITFSGFNEEFGLQEPGEYTTFEEVLSDILGGYGYEDEGFENAFPDTSPEETSSPDASSNPLPLLLNSL